MRSTIVNGFMIRREPGWHPLSLEEVAARCGLHPLLVKRFVALGLIDPLDSETNRFVPEVTLRLQRALRLRRDLGLSYNGVALVLELLDRIEALERRLDHDERKTGFDR
jgi:DNA-binding transcriptional MerR regulator